MKRREFNEVEPLALQDLKEMGHDPATARIEKLAGDASNRSYYRVLLNDDSAPDSMVLMVLADPDPHKGAEEAEKLTEQIHELPFINMARFLADLGLRVPQIHRYNREAGLIFLEDFGDTLLAEVVASADDQKLRQLYRRAIEDMVVINYEGRKCRPNKWVAFMRSFDADLLKWEFDHFVEYGIENKGIKIDTADRELIDREFTTLARRLASMQQVVSHRDYHSRNLMIVNGDLGIIDFQDALLGPAPYDLASLLRDSYINLDEDLVDELVDYYVRLANERGAGLDAVGFRTDFDIQSIQRNLKAAGRFDYIDRVKGNPAFLKHIPHTLANVRRNLGRYDFLAELKKTLGKYVEQLRD